MKKREITSKIENNTLTINVEGMEGFVISPDMLHADMQIAAMLHGLKQKICDAAALGAGYTLTEKRAAMAEVFERITGAEPSWNKVASGGGSVTGLLYRALCRLYPDKSPEALREYHDKLDKSQQAALRKNPKVAAVIEEIKLENTKTAGVDTSGLLDELEGLEG